MYAPLERSQHLCRRVLSIAYSGFLTVADIKGDVGATRVYDYVNGGGHQNIGAWIDQAAQQVGR